MRLSPLGQLVLALLVLVGAVGLATDVRAVAGDPAARGVDLFLHVPSTASPGTDLPVQVQAYGFPSVTHPVTLVGAIVEAGWDPEQFPSGAPPSVQATTDAEGRARLRVPMPDGEPRALTLLVGVRHGAHTRTQTVSVQRGPSTSVELDTPDTRVVPGSTISAWVRATSAASGLPRVDQAVLLELVEGGVVLRSQALTTDAGGVAMARVPIPRIDEPAWSWTLRARIPEAFGASSERTLTPREEIPGMPAIGAGFEPPPAGLRPGDKVSYFVRLRDATGNVIAGYPVRIWVGQGAPPPLKDEDAWLKASTAVTTDGGGDVKRETTAPTLVKASGTALSLVVRTVVEGHALEATASVAVGRANPATAELLPEAHAIVPGLAQHILLRVTDGEGGGVPGEFLVTGDGLSERVTTDKSGEADLVWSAPAFVGATRNVGPCAGGVAAGVVVRPTHDLRGLGARRDPFTLCLPVNRDADSILRAEPLVAHPGDRVRVTVARAGAGPRKPVSVLAAHGGQAASGWIDAGAASTEIVLPPDAAAGRWELSGAAPQGAHGALNTASSFFVSPRALPLLTATRVGGRAAPGGAVDIVAELSDGHGRPMAGSVSAVVIDAHGGGHLGVSSLDIRSVLCGELGTYGDRCADGLEAGAALDPLRRGVLGAREVTPTAPAHDPGASASTELSKSFALVLKSLEGAVFEAAASPDKLLDVRRREGGRWAFNPELLTLATDAMTEPPLTPGGEPLTLPDLMAVDPQVTFDNVARRVTRLKLFQVLAAVRTERRDRRLDPDEPIWKEPNALVRRLVQGGKLTAEQLIDPWGGTLQFVRTDGPTIPFLTPVHGFELRSPGPDGLVGTADDVRDPFERVVRSGSPYALAVQEDRIVDARWDMEVSDDTVAAWQALLHEWTGESLGSGGLGLSGVGEGGGGSGSGIGLGNAGTIGHGRGSSGISTGDAFWSPPVRTDAQGRVRMSIPLGDVETTWRVAFLAVADGSFPAATTMDIPSELPLSASVDTGAAWVAGDVVEATVRVRNRGKAAAHARVTTEATGVAQREDGRKGPVDQALDVPAGGVVTTRVRLRAPASGTGTLVVVTRASGLPEDTVRHTWEVGPAGEKRVLTEAGWVDGERALGVQLDHGYVLRGPPELVLERGYEDALAAALDTLEPERQTSPAALVDTLDAATRIRRWALTKRTPRARALAGIAETFARHAIAHHHVLRGGDGARASFVDDARFRDLADDPLASAGPSVPLACPPTQPDVEQSAFLDALEVEPHPSPDVPPCWGAFVAEASHLLVTDDDPERVARALMALADRPAHAALVASLSRRLRTLVKLAPTGDLTRPDDRASRALVYAALLRTHSFDGSVATADILAARLAALRDASGGYGSTRATLAAVKAILSAQLEGHGSSRVRVRAEAKGAPPLDLSLDVPAEGSVVVPLGSGALAATVTTTGPGVLARLEVPVLRLWSRPPPAQDSPVRVEVVWPAEARAGKVGTLRLLLRQSQARTPTALVDVRIPLPPGVSLAASVGHGTTSSGTARQAQGVLAVRWPVEETQTVVELPVRFGLAGRMQVPEASARIAKESSAPAWAPASLLDVR